MSEKTIQDLTEALVRQRFPQILAKYQNRPLKFEFEFPKEMEDKPELRLSIYVGGGTRMKYTMLFPLTLNEVRMERLEKIV